ncbi:MAG: Hpt domain-containing protein [Burkholderiales bacterium]|nr:Hpt domain-containing protein [Burkholderiales bacterium]
MAHRIKGAAATLGLVQIAAGAAIIEHKLRVPPGTTTAVASFEPELQAMQQAVIEIAATLPARPGSEPVSMGNSESRPAIANCPGGPTGRAAGAQRRRSH